MAMPTSGAVPVTRSEPRTRTALALKSIALRHQIAVLKRSRTRRPCFRRIDRMLWILLSRWWPQWRESLVIVQAETVLGWRCKSWASLWRYRSRGRWRGGRPRVSGELRHLIRRMAHENFLWGAPRIHGGTSHARVPRLPEHRIALHAYAGQAANTIVADLYSQPGQRVPPPRGGSGGVERRRRPAGSVLSDRPDAIRGHAHFADACWAQAGTCLASARPGYP